MELTTTGSGEPSPGSEPGTDLAATDLERALALLSQLSLAARRVVEAVESNAPEDSLRRAALRCAEHQKAYRELSLNVRELSADEHRALAESIQEAARWTALARQATEISSDALAERTRETVVVRRRMGFYGSQRAADGRSCDIAG